MSSQQSTIDCLPDEIIREVISFLPAVPLVRFLCTCKRYCKFRDPQLISFKNYISDPDSSRTPKLKRLKKAFKNAVIRNDRKTIDFILDLFIPDRFTFELGMEIAASCNHQDLVDLFASKGNNHIELFGIWNRGLNGAAKIGNKSKVDEFLKNAERSITLHNNDPIRAYCNLQIDYRKCVRLAALNGHFGLVEYLINKGGDNLWTDALEGAAYGGQVGFVMKNIIKGQVTAKEASFAGAVKSRSFGLLQFLQHKYVKPHQMTLGMSIAIKKGMTDMVELLIDYGYVDWEHGCAQASFYGRKDLVEFFMEKGDSVWRAGLEPAAKGGHLDLVKFFDHHTGAVNWKLATQKASINGHLECHLIP